MDPDTLAAACRILADEWGSYGYRIDSIFPAYGAGALSVRHADGSRFVLAVDRFACHHAHADHDGTRNDEARAFAIASGAAADAHDAAPRPATSPECDETYQRDPAEPSEVDRELCPDCADAAVLGGPS